VRTCHCCAINQEPCVLCTHNTDKSSNVVNTQLNADSLAIILHIPDYAAAMPDHICRSSLPTTAHYQVTHLTPASVSLLAQQVPGHAAPATGRGQMELLLCGMS